MAEDKEILGAQVLRQDYGSCARTPVLDRTQIASRLLLEAFGKQRCGEKFVYGIDFSSAINLEDFYSLVMNIPIYFAFLLKHVDSIVDGPADAGGSLGLRKFEIAIRPLRFDPYEKSLPLFLRRSADLS